MDTFLIGCRDSRKLRTFILWWPLVTSFLTSPKNDWNTFVMVLDELSNAVFRLSLRCSGVELDGPPARCVTMGAPARRGLILLNSNDQSRGHSHVKSGSEALMLRGALPRGRLYCAMGWHLRVTRRKIKTPHPSEGGMRLLRAVQGLIRAHHIFWERQYTTRGRRIDRRGR